MEEVKLTVAQSERYEMIKKALAGDLTNARAAKALRLSIRQVQRLKPRVGKNFSQLLFGIQETSAPAAARGGGAAACANH